MSVDPVQLKRVILHVDFAVWIVEHFRIAENSLPGRVVYISVVHHQPVWEWVCVSVCALCMEHITIPQCNSIHTHTHASRNIHEQNEKNPFVYLDK